MADAKVLLWEGKVLLEDGKLPVHEICCCCPCAADEPVATVSGVAGACAGVNGDYTCFMFTESKYICRWDLRNAGHTEYLVLEYCREDGTWCALIPDNTDGFGKDTCGCDNEAAEVATLGCVNGNIQGTFALTGHGNCAGETATVVVS